MSSVIKLEDIFRFLRNHEEDKLMDAIIKNENIDLNERDEQENYLLTYAVRFNKKNIVSFLLEHGAKYDIVDRIGRSILYDAIESNFMEIMELILEHAHNAIGIVITDIRDSNGNIPIHYAIHFRNLRAIKKLIEYGSKLYIVDKDGYNSLHLAVKTKKIEIVSEITKVIKNLNAKTFKGDTALHIAINYQYTDIAKHLITIGADPNIADDADDLTPLHLAVGWNNTEIVDFLLEYDVDVNAQDYYGNTALAYSVKERYNQCFDSIIKKKPNLNNWNIDGKIILHEVLDFYNTDVENSRKYIDAIIENSSLTYQDSFGNTCLHYLVDKGLWKKYIDIIRKKKINIFAKNSGSQMVIDLVDKDSDDFNLLIKTAVESYIYLLQYEEDWVDEVNKICSRNFTDMTDEQKKVLAKYDKVKRNSKIITDEQKTVCYNIIEERILNTLQLIRSNSIECCPKSYPTNDHDDIIISEGVVLESTTYTGSLLDILFGLLFLLRKHNACSTLSKDSNFNTKLCEFYKSRGMAINGGHCELLNFEMVWIENKMYTIDNFIEYFKACYNLTGVRWIIIPIGIEMKVDSHSNYLIFDKNINEVERFEPHGGTTPIGFNYGSQQMDTFLEQYFAAIDPSIKYIKPSDYIPKIGFQMMDSQEEKTQRIGDPKGFCALWCVWYVDQRLSYPHYSREKLIQALFSNIHERSISYRNLIRNYSRNIIRERDNILASVGLNINDWNNEKYTHNTADKLMMKLYDEMGKIKKK